MASKPISSYGLNFGGGSSAGGAIPAYKAVKTGSATSSGPFNTMSNVKSGAIGDRINQSMGSYDANQQQNQADLSNFASLFQSNTPQVTGYTGQENTAIDNFYNGNVANDLNRLSTQRNMALRGVAGLALQNARHMQVANGLLNGAASGSYTNAQAMSNANDIYTQAALDHANQQQQNYNYLTGQQLALRGQRGQATDALATRSLQPYNLRNADLTQAQGQLGYLNAQDKLNTFYGLGKPMETRNYGLGYSNNTGVGTPDQFYADSSARNNYGLNF